MKDIDRIVRERDARQRQARVENERAAQRAQAELLAAMRAETAGLIRNALERLRVSGGVDSAVLLRIYKYGGRFSSYTTKFVSERAGWKLGVRWYSHYGDSVSKNVYLLSDGRIGEEGHNVSEIYITNIDWLNEVQLSQLLADLQQFTPSS